MSIQDEVAFTLDTWTQNGGTLSSDEGNPREIAAELADAGLLAPELPAPEERKNHPGSKCWEVCTDPSAAAMRHIGVRVDHEVRIKVNAVGECSPGGAREVAYALLAAANYAEGEGA